jgi:hypothetical protein
MRSFPSLSIVNAFTVALILMLGSMVSQSVVGADELRDPMQPPPFALKKFRQAKFAGEPTVAKPKVVKTQEKSLQLTSILFSKDRKIAIIDDQMLAVGDKIKDAKLIRLTRMSARLLRKGKVIDLSLNTDLSAIEIRAVESDL